MNRPSGFVPIPFRHVGRLLFVLGSMGLILLAASNFADWLSLPEGTFAMSVAGIAIGLYLIFIVPDERDA